MYKNMKTLFCKIYESWVAVSWGKKSMHGNFDKKKKNSYFYSSFSQKIIFLYKINF